MSVTSLIPVTQGGWLCAAQDSGVMHQAQEPCFGFATLVMGRAVGTSPLWVCLCLASQGKVSGGSGNHGRCSWKGVG